MALTDDEVQKIAHLARLQITSDEAPQYAETLSSILDMVAKMNEVDTDNVAPMAHPLEVKQRLRPDQVTETDQRDRFQQQAPLTEDGLYLVPKVIE